MICLDNSFWKNYNKIKFHKGMDLLAMCGGAFFLFD